MSIVKLMGFKITRELSPGLYVKVFPEGWTEEKKHILKVGNTIHGLGPQTK